jgi:hypothetical protein
MYVWALILLPIEDADDQWEVHRSSAATGSGKAARRRAETGTMFSLSLEALYKDISAMVSAGL